MWKVTQTFGKFKKNLGMAQIHVTWLKYFRNGFTMLEMA